MAMLPRIQEYAPRALTEDDCCVVISQSCDVVHRDFAIEPAVELVLARSLRSPANGTYTYAKNARRLHFFVEQGRQEIPHEALARERFSVPRELLGEHPPDSTRRLGKTELRALLNWIWSRYGRQAFPDKFNDRITQVVERKIKPILKKLPRLKTLYVSLSSWEELPADTDYKVFLIGTMQVEDFETVETRTAAEKGILQIASSLRSCAGVQVSEAQVLSEADITLDYVRTLERWNFDHISLQDTDGHVFSDLEF
jgi:hypothetical protein